MLFVTRLAEETESTEQDHHGDTEARRRGFRAIDTGVRRHRPAAGLQAVRECRIQQLEIKCCLYPAFSDRLTREARGGGHNRSFEFSIVRFLDVRQCCGFCSGPGLRPWHGLPRSGS